ncbi:ganglioside GM2 activator [Anoplophora glabripennis]|uniref:ganglioside GM2 activator n=1 Tax=Anoplophora glabripennis TaxID=217634 RepID=UPI000874B62E|nr:ganglioside GM2 activator [Anoplophora glabripennis]
MIYRVLKLTILFLSISQSSAKISIPSDLNVIITSLTKCQRSGQYPVEVYNVVVNLDKGKIRVTGTLNTSIDLVSPIKAILKVEKDELGAWIEIPCINSVGSCTYDDLCIHSIPSNESCPKSFIDNNVPCRCPIPKGNYTIPSSLQFEIYPNDYSSVYNGKYWTRATILHKNMNLACYEVYFTIENSIHEENNEIDMDYDSYMNRIFVTLV